MTMVIMSQSVTQSPISQRRQATIKPARILVDTDLVDRPGDLDVGVPAEDLPDALARPA
jgi:hypothetical protein